MIRATTARLVRALRLRRDLLRHRGSAVECPLCGRRFDAFDRHAGYWRCWRCGADSRHRATWLLLTTREDLAEPGRLLHLAPEWCLERLMRGRYDDYVTGDLDPEGVDLELDLQALPLPDASLGAVICSHVLEHVDDDRRAMRELRRGVAPGGWVLVAVPIAADRPATDEDPSVTDPDERIRRFWQADHVRLYAPDIRDRLADAGFDVELIRPATWFGAPLAARHGLTDEDWLWLCRPG